MLESYRRKMGACSYFSFFAKNFLIFILEPVKDAIQTSLHAQKNHIVSYGMTLDEDSMILTE